jgi:hypothetical protein
MHSGGSFERDLVGYESRDDQRGREHIRFYKGLLDGRRIARRKFFSRLVAMSIGIAVTFIVFGGLIVLMPMLENLFARVEAIGL